jgi:apolipoprotein N-acyltransferase
MKRILLATAGGVLYFLGFCGYEQFYLSWVCMVPALWALDSGSLGTRQALATGLAFGAAASLGIFYWIGHTLIVFGGLPAPAAVAGCLLFSVLQGGIMAIWAGAIHLLKSRRVPLYLISAPALVVSEWFWPALFPSYLSNSQYRQVWLIGSLDLVGPAALSGLIAFASAVAYQSLRSIVSKDRPLPVLALSAFAALFSANLAYGAWSTGRIDGRVAESDRSLQVGLVQANIGPKEKRRNAKENLAVHQELSLALETEGAELIIWPESAYFAKVKDGNKGFGKHVHGKVRTPLLFGGLRIDGEDETLYNTAYLTDAAGRVLDDYDKNRLVMFGEYMPFGDTFPALYRLSTFTNRHSPGTDTEPLTSGGIRFGILICYEDILPAFVREAASSDPEVLVNLTNDAWFGDTLQPGMHLGLSVSRAVEQRRFLVRSTNTGVSAFVDPAGRILGEIPTWEKGVLMGSVVPLEGSTLYTRWGEWVPVLCLVFLSLAGMARRREVRALP